MLSMNCRDVEILMVQLLNYITPIAHDKVQTP